MKNKVAVIGAGIAGISSAMYLAERGLSVKLFESANNIGGRMSSFADTEIGELLDLGQHIMIGAYVNFFNLLKKLGTKDLLYQQKKFKVRFLMNSDKIITFEQKFFNDNIGFILGLFLLKGVGLKSKFKMANLISKIIHQKIRKSGLSCQEFLLLHKQENDLIKLFWEPFIIATMNAQLNDAPADILINILYEIFSNGFSKAKIVIPKTELLNLISPVEKYLSDRNCELCLNHRLKRIEIRNGKVATLTINDFCYDDFDAVILAIPPDSLKQIGRLSNLNIFLELVNNFRTSSIITVYLWLDKEITTEKFIGLVDSPLHWLFNIKRISGEITEKHKLYKYAIVISSADKYAKLTREQTLQMCLDELMRFFPNFSTENVINWKVLNYKKATVLLTPQNLHFRATAVTEYENLFLAGDWTSTGLPATIEGAVRSGETAARCVINYLSMC